MINQPFSTYNGGKSGHGTFQQIINLIPPFTKFIEGMAGNAGIVAHINSADPVVINDIDAGIIAAWAATIAESNYAAAYNITLENLHYLDLIAKYDCARSEQVFFYFDPPYLKDTRKSTQDLYKYEWSIEDHLEFLSAAVTVQSNCMISCYQNEMYQEHLSSWSQHSFNSTTRHGSALETIYFNYEIPATLADYSYLGNTHTQRQQIKRMVARWEAKFKALPTHQRELIFQKLSHLR